MLIRFIFIFFIFSNLVFASNVDFFEDFINKLSAKQGYVIAKEDNGVILTDFGKQDNVFTGLNFTIFKQGKKIVHPITGEVVAETKEKVGSGIIKDVYEKYSTARLLEGDNISVGDYIEIDYPIAVNTEYYNIDKYIIEEINGAIKRTGKFVTDKMSPFTLRFYKNDKYGLVFEFMHLGNTLAKYYSTELKITKGESQNKIFTQQVDTKGYFYIAVCRLDEGATRYAVLAEDKRVDIYKIIDNNFNYLQTIDAKFKKIISVDCGDLNNNKKDEIFISISNNGNGAKTYIYEYKDKKLNLLKDSLPLVIRAVFVNGDKKIVAQRLTKDGRFVGNINYLTFNGDYIKGESIENTQGFSIYGFGLGDVNNDGKLEVIRSDDKSYLEIYSAEGDIIYKSREPYSDSRNYFLMKERIVDKLSNKEDVDKLQEITSRIYVRDRIFIDNKGRIITGKIIKNDNLVPTFEKYFNKTISISSFENSMLKSVWSSNDLGADVNDFYIVTEGDKTIIYVLKGEEGNFFSSSKSQIVSMEINNE